MKGTLYDFFPKQLQSEDLGIFYKEQVLAARVIQVVMYLLKPFNVRKHNNTIKVFAGSNDTKLQLQRINLKQALQKDGWVYCNKQHRLCKMGDKQCKSDLFCEQLVSFLQKLGLLIMNTPQQQVNPLMVRINRLNNTQYQQRYLWDVSKFQTYHPNYLFYLNKLKVTHNNINFKNMQTKRGNYHWLQHTHDYVQWMFPNHYASKFNSNSYPLSYAEAEMFYQSQQIGLAIIQSINIFFDFIGVKMSPVDGHLTLKSHQRLKDAIVRNLHNHLRIMRVLACLSITGFRVIALRLIQFLRHTLTLDKQLLSQKWKFHRDWQIYDDNHYVRAKQMCFLVQNKFKSNHRCMQKYFKEQPTTQTKLQTENMQHN